jgi:PAS domain S-box-containing protein
VDLQVKDPAVEIKRLQRCMNDLLSLVALPAIWSGNEPSQIIPIVLDALLGMLDLDFVYARFNDAADAGSPEILRVAASCRLTVPPSEISRTLRNWFKDEGQKLFPPVRNRLGDEDISVFPVPLGIHGEMGMIVAGSERTDFPSQTENLLLSVAANQATVGLHEAKLLTAQKQIAVDLDAQVVRSEERWRSVFENSAVGVALTDLNGRFIATNPVFQKMLGYAEDELQQLTLFEITHEEDVEQSRALIAELLAGKRQQFQIEKQYRRKGGGFVWAQNNVSIVPGTERVARFLMALSEDITQRKRSEEALARARSELAKVAQITSLGVLTASIAHEVNQPLSGIVTNASTCLRMLSANPPNIDGARETVRRTIRDGNRASDVITRLRALYSKKEPWPESMDLNEATREVTALSLSELQRSGVILRHEFADGLPPVVGDRIQLQQVILNLLRNAGDAMSTVHDRPRELLITTQPDGENEVRLSVKDAGVGFTPEAASKVFEAFYTTKSDGMGIGLSVSRSIIEAHQGRIWATSNDGPGCTFTFAIPCRPQGWADRETCINRADSSADAA